jgi:hypothetical protein
MKIFIISFCLVAFPFLLSIQACSSNENNSKEEIDGKTHVIDD